MKRRYIYYTILFLIGFLSSSSEIENEDNEIPEEVAKKKEIYNFDNHKNNNYITETHMEKMQQYETISSPENYGIYNSVIHNTEENSNYAENHELDSQYDKFYSFINNIEMSIYEDFREDKNKDIDKIIDEKYMQMDKIDGFDMTEKERIEEYFLYRNKALYNYDQNEALYNYDQKTGRNLASKVEKIKEDIEKMNKEENIEMQRKEEKKEDHADEMQEDIGMVNKEENTKRQKKEEKIENLYFGWDHAKEECYDDDWYDILENNCLYYKWIQKCDRKGQYENQGMTALYACCHCGGGEIYNWITKKWRRGREKIAKPPAVLPRSKGRKGILAIMYLSGIQPFVYSLLLWTSWYFKYLTAFVSTSVFPLFGLLVALWRIMHQRELKFVTFYLLPFFQMLWATIWIAIQGVITIWIIDNHHGSSVGEHHFDIRQHNFGEYQPEDISNFYVYLPLLFYSIASLNTGLLYLSLARLPEVKMTTEQYLEWKNSLYD